MISPSVSKKMQSKLTKLCKDCELRKTRGCPYSNKIECGEYTFLIATTVLTQCERAALTTIPAGAYIRGLQAHRYVGEVLHYSCVEYAHLPVDFFISGLKAHGYSGELRKTRVVTI